MTHKDFLYNVQKLCQVDAAHCSVLLNSLCRLMSQAAVEQVPVVVHGLGKFLSHKHPEYIQEDPQTGQQTLFPPRISYRLYTEEEALVNNEEEKNDSVNDILEIQLAEQAKMSVHEAKCFIDALSETINQALNAGEEVEVHGLGTFRIVESRQGELHRIAYTPDEQMRNAVNAPFSCFEPVIIKVAKETTSPTSILTQDKPVDEPIEFQDEKNESMEENNEPIVRPQSETLVEGQPEQATDEQIVPTENVESQTESEDIAPAAEQPLDSNVDPEPEPAPKHPRAEAEPASISQHYQEFADEEKKTPLIRLLSVLLILACAALGWFIYKLEHPSIKLYDREIIEHAVVAEEQDVIDTTETSGEELFFGENNNNVTEEATAQTSEELTASEVDAQAEANRLAAEKLAAEKAEAERIAAEKLAAEKAEAEKKAAEKAAKEKTANEQKQQASATSAIAGRLKKSDGSYATHKLGQGGRLTLVALEHYGDKVFWPYIYEVNRDKLSNPSLVQPGMVLYLPDPKYFGINANDPNSVAKAKAKAAQYLK